MCQREARTRGFASRAPAASSSGRPCEQQFGARAAKRRELVGVAAWYSTSSAQWSTISNGGQGGSRLGVDAGPRAGTRHPSARPWPRPARRCRRGRRSPRAACRTRAGVVAACACSGHRAEGRLGDEAEGALAADDQVREDLRPGDSWSTSALSAVAHRVLDARTAARSRRDESRDRRRTRSRSRRASRTRSRLRRLGAARRRPARRCRRSCRSAAR